MFKIDATGLDVVIKKFNNLSKEIKNDVEDELNAWAMNVEQDAKMLVKSDSYNNGRLLGSINHKSEGMEASVSANTEYAAYIEFGTRKFAAQYVATLPQDWQSYASTFKGPTGKGFNELLLSIKQWCQDKGIDEGDAYMIALRIAVNGVRARPFLYPSVNKNLPIFIKNIKNILKDA
jgi:HK97 gp10 family phage protein